jgi:hypothetical protein
MEQTHERVPDIAQVSAPFFSAFGMSKRVPPPPLSRFDTDQGLRGTLDAELGEYDP